MKRILIAILLILCAALCCGCGAPNAAELLEGSLDLAYRNRYTEAYLKAVGLTAEEAQQQYEAGMEAELAVFAGYFDIDLTLCSREAAEEFRGFCRDVYGSAKYEVGKPAKTDTGYTVALTVYPVDILQKFRDGSLSGLMSDWQTRYDKGEFDAMDKTQYEDLWIRTLLSALKDVQPGYLDGEIVTVTLTRDSDGVTVISPEDLTKIDSLVIAY